MNTNNQIKVAVVEDEPGMRADLVEFLCDRGFDAVGAEDAAALYRLMADETPDLVILDVRLPGESGLEVAKRLSSRNDIRVIILTAQASDMDRVEGLNAGADAYLSKDKSLAVIEATCHSVLRRSFAAKAMPTPDSDSKTLPSWELHTLTWMLTTPDGKSLKLTHAEQSFLNVLFQQPGQSVSRPTILAEMGKADTVINRRNLDSCVRRIRTKVAAETGADIPIESSYGFGYVFQGNARFTPEPPR